MILGLSLLLGLLVVKPTIAKAPKQSNEDYFSKDLTIKNNAIQENTPQQPVGQKERKSDNIAKPYNGRIYTKEEVIQLIKDYSVLYGIEPTVPLRIAACESGYNQFSKNNHSSASGVYQFLTSTWSNQPAGKKGVSVFDADANVQAAVWLLAHGKNSMWVCK